MPLTRAFWSQPSCRTTFSENLSSAVTFKSTTETPDNHSMERQHALHLHGRSVCSCICSLLVHGLLVGVFLFQSAMMDWMLIQRGSWYLIYVCLEAPLLAHLLRNWRLDQALQSSSLQWIVYSWLFSTKTCVFFFGELPDPKNDDYTIRLVVSMMCLTPVFYMLITFRTLRQIFNQSDSSASVSDGAGSPSSYVKRRQEHVTLDVILLQDMVWHVVIDMTDMISAMHLAQPEDPNFGVGPSLVKQFPDEIRSISKCAGLFVFLGFFFHQQSFPNIEVAGSHKEFAPGKATPRPLQRGSSSVSSAASVASSIDLQSEVSNRVSEIVRVISGRSRTRSRSISSIEGMTASTTQGKKDSLVGVDVVKARKRSAMVSILLVDLPLFILRSYIYSLSLSVHGEDLMPSLQQPTGGSVVGMATSSNVTVGPLGTDSAQRPQLDKWWIKNALCLLLQATQLRFVQQADVEQSQKLQWRDIHQENVRRKQRRGRHRLHDPELKKAFQDMQARDRELHASRDEDVEVAVAAALRTSPSHADHQVTSSEAIAEVPSSEANAEHVFSLTSTGADRPSTMVSDVASDPVSPVGEIVSEAQSDNGGMHPSTQRRNCTCVRRCAGSCHDSLGRMRRRCGCYPVATLLHALVGLAAGWMIAKQDFQLSTDALLLAMGKDPRATSS